MMRPVVRQIVACKRKGPLMDGTETWRQRNPAQRHHNRRRAGACGVLTGCGGHVTLMWMAPAPPYGPTIREAGNLAATPPLYSPVLQKPELRPPGGPRAL